MESARCDPDPRGAKKSLRCATGVPNRRAAPTCTRASAPPAPSNGVRLRPATAARDRSPGHRSSLPPTNGHCWPTPGGRPLSRRREMVSVYGRQRLRGTAALQVSIDHRCHQRMVVAGRLLEGVRSLGAVKRCQFTAGNGCEGPQPSRSLPIIVATNEWSLLADPPWRASALSAP